MVNNILNRSKWSTIYSTEVNGQQYTQQKQMANNILNRSDNTQQNFQLLLNGAITSDNKKIANSFNQYFTNMADTFSKKIPKTNNAVQDYLKNPNEHSLFLKETSPHEISLIIDSLKSSNTSNIYIITSKLIKLGSSAITYNLALIFNKSIQEGMFPDIFKLAKVIPIFKNDSPLAVSNYRPISLLPIVCQIFERLMYNRLLYRKTQTIKPQSIKTIKPQSIRIPDQQIAWISWSPL